MPDPVALFSRTMSVVFHYVFGIVVIAICVGLFFQDTWRAWRQRVKQKQRTKRR